MEVRVIGHIRNDFTDKFGIPRQSGLTETESTVVLEGEFARPEALRGIEEYSHLWLLWHFSENGDTWHPTVRPPRLGGNTRVGVFATRSPFRPSPIGLSCVRLVAVKNDPPALTVTGADLMDGTPILDIKPYLPYTDAHPDARGGFAEDVKEYALDVSCDPALLAAVPEEKRAALLSLLSQDPRPGYRHDDEDRVYGLGYAGFNVRFTVKGSVLTVCAIEP